MVTIVDYGVGNLTSVLNMFKRIGVEADIASDPKVIQRASKLLLPGVGAFDTCAKKLFESGLMDLLHKMVLEDHIPVLGVCVGMQLLFENSEEGNLKGLGWIKGKVVKFKDDVYKMGLKVPHMGWADVLPKKNSKLLKEMYPDPRFYFVHSFYAQPANSEDTLLEADYGYTFTAAVQKNNIAGVQFHPEKSHKFGMKLLENFAFHF
jgi:glutamine amidotransferase